MEVRSQKRPLRVREVRMATSGSFSLRTHSYFAGTAVLQRPLGSGFGGRMLPASVTRSEWGTHFAATVANENKILVAGRVTGTNQGFGLSCGWQSCLSEWALGRADPLARPLVCAGTLDPLAKRNNSRLPKRPTGASAADQGVRPTSASCRALQATLSRNPNLPFSDASSVGSRVDTDAMAEGDASFQWGVPSATPSISATSEPAT